MISINVNWLVILVYSSPAIDFVLAFGPAAAHQPESDRHEGPTKPPVNLDLSTPLECLRPCREEEPPKICYYHFTLEMYTVLGGACQNCTPTNTNQLDSTCQCVTSDGFERGILTVNRMIPGPSIQVCKNDRIIVDVANHMEGMECTIHWHGILHRKSPYYDGVPFITQCPILQGNTFRYDYLAADAGTFFWHAHTGVQKMDGIYGSLIIREPPRYDPSSKFYDKDLPTHVMLLSDLIHDQSIERFPGHLATHTGQDPDSLLINGRGKFTDPITGITTTTPYEVFILEPNCRYRMRMINSFCGVCGAELTIAGHILMVIAVDGVAVKPTNVTTINSFPGERVDFIPCPDEGIKEQQTSWIHLRALGACTAAGVEQHAILRYEGHSELPTSAKPTYTQHLPLGKVLNPPDGLCHETRPDAVCYNQLRSAIPVDVHEKPCLTMYFEVSFGSYSLDDLFKPNTYQTFLAVGGGHTIARVNNMSFEFPPSPPLSQYEDIPEDYWCYPDRKHPNYGGGRSCTQRIDVPLHCMVECIICDGIGVPILSHPIHLHGYAFNVIGMGKSPVRNVTKMTARHAQELDARNQLYRNFDRPPFKDTIPIPSGGWAAIRFRADNPGWWLWHCHFLYHALIGMELVLHVGEQEDLTPVPPGFPKCGDFLPPIEVYNEPKHTYRYN